MNLHSTTGENHSTSPSDQNSDHIISHELYALSKGEFRIFPLKKYQIRKKTQVLENTIIPRLAV